MKARLIVLAAVLGPLTWAATAAEDPARLSKDLTPAGAERAGNKDGTIPEWTGASPFSGTWKPGTRRSDAFRFKDDKPLFSIDASNVDKYVQHLTPGQIARIKSAKDYRMDVYPSRRTCNTPDWVAENHKKNLATAKISDDGWSLKEAVVPGVPFPMPKTGVEVMWKTKMRYRGLAVDLPLLRSTVSPRRGGNDWIQAEMRQTYYYPWGRKGSTLLSTLPQWEWQLYFGFEAPAALAGQAAIVNMPLAKSGTETFYYFPGQRRVRRMPAYAYDAPQIGFENQYLTDEPQVFTGTIDRFDWTIVGKKEVYVPYNAFGAYDYQAKWEDAVTPRGINPAYRRYELHRVWVVEAKVKAGMRHASARKVLYLDEDSWNMLAGEDYDQSGALWKFKEGFVMPVYETGTCDATAFIQFNLLEDRFVFDIHALGTGKDLSWIVDEKALKERSNASFYTSENLRAISER